MEEKIMSMEEIIVFDGSWVLGNAEKDEYVEYWIGDLYTGYPVLVSSLDWLRYEVKRLKSEMKELEQKIYNLENGIREEA